MARQEMFVDLLKLKQVIDQLEDEQVAQGAPIHRPFRSRNELHKAVAATDWGQAIGLTPVVVALRIDRYSIECRTGARARAPVDPSVATAAAGPERKAVYRGIDLDAFVAPFLERGLEVTSLTSIITSSVHPKNVNLKIQAAWHDLRDRFNIPRVGEKRQEVQSVLPLDQIRLPGSIPVEPISTLENVPVINSELDQYDPNVEKVGASGAGWREGGYDMAQPGDDAGWGDQPYEETPAAVVDDAGWGDQPYDEPPVQEGDPFYDPATDEANLDQLQVASDVIEQEGGVYTQAPPDSEPFTREDLAQVRDDLEATWDDGEVVSEAGMQTEYGQESGVNLDQEPYLDELPLEYDPNAEVAEGQVEFYGEFEGTEEIPSGEFHGEFTPTGTTAQGEVVGEFHGEYQTTQEAPPDVFQGTDDVYQGEYQDEPCEAQEDLQNNYQDENQEVYPERRDPADIDRELEEWLASEEAPADSYQDPYEGPFEEGEPLQDGHSEPAPQEGAPEEIQDEYLPLDYEPEESTPVIYDNDNYDSSLFETEETDPNQT